MTTLFDDQDEVEFEEDLSNLGSAQSERVFEESSKLVQARRPPPVPRPQVKLSTAPPDNQHKCHVPTASTCKSAPVIPPRLYKAKDVHLHTSPVATSPKKEVVDLAAYIAQEGDQSKSKACLFDDD